MSAITPNPTTSALEPPGAFAFKISDKDASNDRGTTSNIQYWSGLLLSRQIIPYQVTKVGEIASRPDHTVVYGAISAMIPFQNSSFEELRLAYYFYDMDRNRSDGPNDTSSIAPQSAISKKRSWEKPVALPVPRPTPSQSTSAFVAVFPSPSPSPAPISVQTQTVSVSEAVPYTSPFSSLTSKLASVSNQLFTNQPTKPAEAPPVQAMAALGLGSQPTTPARKVSGVFGQPMGGIPLNYPRSPAAERVPAINTAEIEWENARQAVARRKTLLQQAQAEYDNAVRVEREKFNAYSEARMNLDK